jgi:D-glycero-D-manno-heptose 1,7-bisphosphate phosphatase
MVLRSPPRYRPASERCQPLFGDRHDRDETGSILHKSNMKAVLLDRDGVINPLVYYEDAGVIDAPFTASQFSIFPHVPRAIRLLNDLGLRVAIVSNQPGIAKGHLKPETLNLFETAMLSAVQQAGGKIDRIYYCLHHPESKVPELRQSCRCRKPETGMLEQASRDLDVSLDQCYMVGDGISDLQAGTRAGCRTVFVGRWKCEICQFMEGESVRPHLVAKDLWHAAQVIQTEVLAAKSVEVRAFTPANDAC